MFTLTDDDLFEFGRRFSTILADPPWRFTNRTGKVAPEHRRLSRYETMTIEDICALPVEGVAARTAHLYLWTPNALYPGQSLVRLRVAHRRRPPPDVHCGGSILRRT